MAPYDNDKMRDDSPSDAAMKDSHMGLGRYLATRLPTLKPPMARAPNPFKLLAMLNLQQWLFFLVAFFAWSWDAFDFFTVSLTLSQLGKQFEKSTSQITWGITLVLMFRSVGAVIFGIVRQDMCIAADRYGRKWSLVVNNVLFIVLELGTGFCNTTFVVGTSYQLGNLVSSASSTIESTIGERFPLPPKGETKRYKYGKVIAIFMACVYLYVIILAFLGPEYRGRRFDVAHDEDMNDATGHRGVPEGSRDGEEKRGSSDTEGNQKATFTDGGSVHAEGQRYGKSDKYYEAGDRHILKGVYASGPPKVGGQSVAGEIE
ncbi:MAG: hypothetical protein Q9226_006539 [Calogaya cf. arnoldii]